MADVFLSYCRHERPLVEQIAGALQELELDVWFDASMSAGETFNAEIDREARAARSILVCWSPDARDSKWVIAEAMIGFEQDKLAACYIAGPDGFSPPTPFNASHFEDVRAWLAATDPAHAGWKSVLRRLGKLCERPELESRGALNVQRAYQLEDLRKTWENLPDKDDEAVIERFLGIVTTTAAGSGLAFEVELRLRTLRRTHAAAAAQLNSPGAVPPAAKDATTGRGPSDMADRASGPEAGARKPLHSRATQSLRAWKNGQKITGKKIAIASMKSGVGKTTTTIALAQTLAAIEAAGHGVRVLAIDLDEQAYLSFALCGDEKLVALVEGGKTIDAFLEDRIVFGKSVPLGDFVERGSGGPNVPKHGGAPIALIPCSPGLRTVEREVVNFLSRRKRNLTEVEKELTELMAEELNYVCAEYDFTLLNCGRASSTLMRCAIASADLVITPTVPDFIASFGLAEFCRSIGLDRKGPGATPWVLANKVRDTPHHSAMLGEMRAEAKQAESCFQMFNASVPQLPWQSVADYSTSDETMRDAFAQIVEEMLETLSVAQ